MINNWNNGRGSMPFPGNGMGRPQWGNWMPPAFSNGMPPMGNPQVGGPLPPFQSGQPGMMPGGPQVGGPLPPYQPPMPPQGAGGGFTNWKPPMSPMPPQGGGFTNWKPPGLANRPTGFPGIGNGVANGFPARGGWR